MDKLRIGLIGLGTVGSGVYKSLQEFDNIEIVQIAVRNINKPRSVDVPREMLTDNPYDVVNNPSIDVVVGKRKTHCNRKQRTSCKTRRRTFQPVRKT